MAQAIPNQQGVAPQTPAGAAPALGPTPNAPKKPTNPADRSGELTPRELHFRD